MALDLSQTSGQSSVSASSCPPERQLFELTDGSLSAGKAVVLRAHLEHCRKCSDLLVALSETASDLAKTGRSDMAKPELLSYPERVAEFSLLRLLGHGAMGQVFIARDTFLDRIVAVKFLSSVEASVAARERFYVEARAVARLQHTNVVTLYRAGEEQGRPYLISELVRGESLDQIKKPVSGQKVLNIALGIARGLAAAHQHGVLHRDIKPANVMLGSDGVVKILDFGLAKLIEILPASAPPASVAGSEPHSLRASLAEFQNIASPSLTRTGATLGTPLYMAPESWRSEPASPQTDVYSFGVLLYELCAGHPPHHAETVLALGWRVIEKDAKPLAEVALAVEPRLAAVVDRCLRRNPAERFASGKELQDAIERINTKGPSVPRRLVLTGLFLILVALVTFAGLGLNRVRQAQRQAELAQHLGQQIKDMEWMLRSARQLPLHDLGREKSIIRERMAQLQAELVSYGEMGRGLTHYALGRGHMALHEYPQALVQLQQAIDYGNHRADVYYSLGFVLGKHYEQARYKARLSGGGDWAKKQIQEIELKFVRPAVESLQRSRAMKSAEPEYLEALIAYYQRDYELALSKANAAQFVAPWLYEASKLIADIHLERAMQARDSGRKEEAEREFADSVKSYQEAAAAGQSDAEVYEGLAEAWIRQIEMALISGQSTEAAYASAVAASDKITIAEPQSIAGRLKKGYAALMTMALSGAGLTSAARVQQCLAEAQAVLDKEPENPYASDVAAGCNAFAADSAQARGEDPEPLIRKALGLLEPAVLRNPHFLWGLNDLSNLYVTLAVNRQLHGAPSMREYLEKSIQYSSMALTLDGTYPQALQNLLFILSKMIDAGQTEKEIKELVEKSDSYFAKCMEANNQALQCQINYFVVYTIAATRMYLANSEPQPLLKRAFKTLADVRKQGGHFLDAEKHDALAQWVAASDSVKKKQEPGVALTELQAALNRCLSISAQDALCRTLSAQGELIAADWAAQNNRSTLPFLQRALQKAAEATKSLETYPDSWQVMAETRLRLARVQARRSTVREFHIAAGLDAAETVFTINPHHAKGRATQGALYLLRGQSMPDPAVRRQSARLAVASFAHALQSDSMLASSLAPLIAQATAMAVP